MSGLSFASIEALQVFHCMLLYNNMGAGAMCVCQLIILGKEVLGYGDTGIFCKIHLSVSSKFYLSGYEDAKSCMA